MSQCSQPSAHAGLAQAPLAQQHVAIKAHSSGPSRSLASPNAAAQLQAALPDSLQPDPSPKPHVTPAQQAYKLWDECFSFARKSGVSKMCTANVVCGKFNGEAGLVVIRHVPCTSSNKQAREQAQACEWALLHPDPEILQPDPKQRNALKPDRIALQLHGTAPSKSGIQGWSLERYATAANVKLLRQTFRCQHAGGVVQWLKAHCGSAAQAYTLPRYEPKTSWEHVSD